MSQTLALPAPSAVDAAEDKLASMLSDLDEFITAAELFVHGPVPLDDAAFLERSGIAVERPDRSIDPAIIARLLVFADELLDDAEKIREDAAKLRRLLLTAYRHHVIERIGADRA